MISSRSDVQAKEKVKTPVEGQVEERFSGADVESLRADLMQSGLDSWQAGDLITAFLAGRGYGVSSEAARDAAVRMEEVGCSAECVQSELEKLALVM